MRAMIEIEWIGGHVTRIPELALGGAFGESVQAEVDIRFDDLSDGLVVEVCHHEPDGEAGGDPRGRACAVYSDFFYSLIEPEDLGRVQCVFYEGTPTYPPLSAAKGMKRWPRRSSSGGESPGQSLGMGRSASSSPPRRGHARCPPLPADCARVSWLRA